MPKGNRRHGTDQKQQGKEMKKTIELAAEEAEMLFQILDRLEKNTTTLGIRDGAWIFKTGLKITINQVQRRAIAGVLEKVK